MQHVIDSIRIFSEDISKTKEFFTQKIGFEIGFEDGPVVVFDLPGTKLIVEEVDLSEEGAAGMVGRFTGISFAVEDMKTTYREMKGKGVHFDDKPDYDAQQAIAHFSDPSGNLFTLIQYPPV